MVARSGGYYGTAFKGERGVTQGDQLSPTIFNVVMGAVVCQWVTGVIADAEARGGWERGGDIRRRYSTQTMAWLPRLAPDGYRVHLTPSSACLTGWACGKMSGRKSAWSVTPVRRQGTCLQQRMGGGSWGRDLYTGSG